MPGTLGIIHSGRMRIPLPLTDFWYSAAGNGDNRTVTFTWDNTPTNNDITGHRINIYNSSDTLIDFADSSGPTATSLNYTFASSSTGYKARLFTKSASGFSSLAALTPSSNRRLSITTGAASYVSTGWGSEVSFTPGHKSQSQWSGEAFNDYTYSGSKAFDNDYGTWWRGQWYAANYPEGSDWISFYLGAGSVNRRITTMYVNLPNVNNSYNGQPFNHAGNINLDQWYNDTWNYTYLGATGTGTNLGGIRYSEVPMNLVLAANTTGIFRFFMYNLGSNPSSFGTRQAVVAEVNGYYQDATSTNIPATANTITDG